MRKITLLFASLFLVMGSAWAQPEVGKMYRIKLATQDLYLTIAGYNGAGSNGAHGAVPFLEKSFANLDQVWVTEATEKEDVFYLKSMSGYYIQHGAWNVDAYDNGTKGEISFISNDDNTYLLKNVNADKWYKAETANGGDDTIYPYCDVPNDQKATKAASFVLEAVDQTETEIPLVINPARAAVEGASNSRVGAYTFDAIYDLSEALDAYEKEETTANFNAVKAAYDAYLANVENFDKVGLTDGEIFTVKCVDTNRGYMAYSTVEGKGSETQAYLAGTNKAEYHPAADAEGVYKEWAIVTKEGKSYIYNVENKKYITSGTPVAFSETPCAVEFIALEGALWEIKFENAGFLSFSPGWGTNCVRTEDGVDNGCKFYLDKTGFEVTPAEIIFPEWDEEYVMLEQYGQTIQFAVEFTPVDAAQAVTWSSSNPELVAIDAETGLAEVVGYTPQGYEMVNITATLADGTKLTLEIAVAVAQEVVEGGIAKIELYSTYREMNAVGDTIHLSPIAYDAEGNVVETSFYYLCEGEGLTDQVTVDFMTGVVTVWEGYAGTVIVTVMDMEGTASATCYLSIYAAGAGNDAKLWEIYLSRFTFPNEYAGDKPFEVGDTYQLTVTFDPENFEDQRLSWTSDDEDVVTVDENGKITAVGVGEATITVTALANPDDEYCTKTCTVTVVAKTTGINAVEADAETVIYDLTGRRVEKMQKGIYIVNGKKVLVK